MKTKPNKTSIIYQLQQAFWQAWQKSTIDNNWDAGLLKPENITIEHPDNDEYGDYASNMAMILAPKLKKNPMDVAKVVLKSFEHNKLDFIDSIKIKKPGFINISINNLYLITQVQKVLKNKDNYGKSFGFEGKKIIVEFAHPNTHKSFHIGHLRNIATGEFLVRTLEAAGAKVVRANYQGDVGMHIAKAMYGLLQIKDLKKKMCSLKTLDQKTKLLTDAYVVGNEAYGSGEKTKEKIRDTNFLVYAAAQQYQQKEHKLKPGSTDYLEFVKGKTDQLNTVYDLWQKTRQWSLDYFARIYQRVYSHFDRYYFESECLAGADRVYEALKKGVLTKSKGAVVFDGKPYKMHTRVFLNSMGLPTYEGKELALAPVELSEHGYIDKLIHVVGPEQTSFFAVTFKVEELLGIQKDQQYHLAYGWVRLKKGKMSSRLGNIVLGEDLIDEAKLRIKKAYKDLSEDIAEQVAVAAVKYSFLRQGVTKDMSFDFDESISLQGNSGPYLQYTYARCQSVLSKANFKNIEFSISNLEFHKEELAILRWLYRFPEVVGESAENYAPNVICTYLYDLAQRYNTFYNKHKIIKAKTKEEKELRLMLTAATAQILKNGLYLLGIKAPVKM